jgi:lipopolysaccharide biosynthesis glycosyltransferase
MDTELAMIGPIRLVVGFDPREAIAYHVFCQSILEKTSVPVCFMPLVDQSIPGYSERHRDGSNRFTYTRFLTPYLMNYEGWAIFADGDMVCNEDIAILWGLRDPQKAVQVVKHQYQSKVSYKYLGSRNENYPRKNWSSVVIWNCGHPENRCLTPDFVSSKDGAFLHRFSWLKDDDLIGDLPKSWNWLAIEYESNPNASLIHYTLGTPCFSDYRDSLQSEYWHDAYARTLSGMEK